MWSPWAWRRCPASWLSSTDVYVALLAAVTMVVTDVLGVILVQAEAANRGWLAGWMDTAQWLVGIVTTTISVTALQGHSFSEKALVVGLVSAANLLGTKLGQVLGARLLRSRSGLLARRGLTLEERVSALEAK